MKRALKIIGVLLIGSNIGGYFTIRLFETGYFKLDSKGELDLAHLLRGVRDGEKPK